MTDWNAYIEHDPISHSDKLYLVRRVGDRTEYFRSDGLWETIDSAFTLPGGEIPRFPLGALQAIAEAVKPGPPAAVVAELREALAVERARVDQVLARAWCDAVDAEGAGQ